jgi:hypothetical protein
MWWGPMVAAMAALVLGLGLAPGSAEALREGVPLPAAEGTRWEIVGGYNTATHHSGDPHAIDLVRADGVTTGSEVRAPASGRVASVGGDCLTIRAEISHLICHLLPGSQLSRGDMVSEGALLGTVAPAYFAGNNGLPHIHYALHRDFRSGLQTLPFTGEYALEGRNLFDTGEANEHAGLTLESSNGLLQQLPAAIVARAAADPEFLVPGWNLVGWTDDQPVETATASIEDSIQSLFIFDAAQQRFATYAPALPAQFNEVESLGFGVGVWVLVENDEGVVWSRPVVDVAREVALEVGFNLVTWTLAAAPVVEAVASLGNAVTAIYAWDPIARAFLSYRRDAPAFVNTLSELAPGQALWVQMDREGVWMQGKSG